jgi:hypothetical protein
MEEEIKQQEPITQEYVKARPQVLPEPSYLPFLLALSLLFIGWGMVATWIISVAGAIGFCVAIFGWIKLLLHERADEQS